MQLASGARLGPYEILSPLGAGGMGEVYRARDPRLDREVAIKVLPEGFARDPERLARFEREAKVLASLNHPNIAAIYGLEESGGVRYLVLELAPGETLAGPLAVEDALPICRQIVLALEEAHAKGVMHRDLKPDNVRVTSAGKVKVLDFGLAKAFHGDVGGSDPSQSPTLTAAGRTREGTILGTAAYMSPEQARGRPLDKRTDIFSFGAVLYEVLAGRRAFPGESVSDTLAAVIRAEPNWTALPADTPANIRILLRRCLEKDLDRRLHDISDARLEIDERGVAVAPRRGPSLPWALAAVAIAAIAAAVWGWARPARPAPGASQPVRRLVIRLPEGEPLALARLMPLGEGRPSFAISPDATRLVYVVERKGTTHLYLRALDQFEAAPIPRTEGGFGPFFSPDGRWIGFFAENKLKKVSVSGGDPVVLRDARNPYGGSWGADGTILFSEAMGTVLVRVPDTGGGVPQVVPVKDKTQRWVWPEVLPGSKTALVTLRAGGVAVLSLETGEHRLLVEGGAGGRYAPSGHLVFSRAGSLLAAPFDLARLVVTGPSAVIVPGVRVESWGAPQCAFSQDGAFVYAAGAAAGAASTPVWVDRQGKIQPVGMPQRAYGTFRLSPDGQRLAIQVLGPGNRDVWVQDLARGTFTRLTLEGDNSLPLWTPDGGRVVFSSSRGGPPNLFWMPGDGSGEPEQLLKSDRPQNPYSCSPDGQTLAYAEQDPSTASDIYVAPLKGDRTPQPFLRTRFTEWGPAFSPDGRWIAYVSDDSGQFEVYVRPYPGPGGKWQVSNLGGEEPIWSRDGKELFYRNGQKWMSATVTLKPEFKAETSRPLFEGPFINVPGLSYDVAPDGRRFLLLQPAEQETGPVTHLNVVLNWFEELRRHVPPAGK